MHVYNIYTYIRIKYIHMHSMHVYSKLVQPPGALMNSAGEEREGGWEGGRECRINRGSTGTAAGGRGRRR